MPPAESVPSGPREGGVVSGRVWEDGRELLSVSNRKSIKGLECLD